MTERQKRFADFYIQSGNATDSYKKAYPTARTQHTAESNGHRLLQRPEVQQYIRAQNQRLADDRIADMKEINQFWTKILRDEERDIKDRIKVSELRAKVQGAFSDKSEAPAQGEFTVEIKVVDP